jgi:hypothetical protein
MTRQTRRRFLQASAAVIAAPTFVPASARGRDGKAAPSERLVMGVIGTGGQGRGLLGGFLRQPDVQVVAVCDVDARRLGPAKDSVHKAYKNTDCASYKDFRELVGHKDLDAVVVATPDHWHALCSIAAAKAKKHVYCEKPLTNSIGEGRALCNAVKDNGVVLQTGSHELRLQRPPRRRAGPQRPDRQAPHRPHQPALHRRPSPPGAEAHGGARRAEGARGL